MSSVEVPPSVRLSLVEVLPAPEVVGLADARQHQPIGFGYDRIRAAFVNRDRISAQFLVRLEEHSAGAGCGAPHHVREAQLEEFVRHARVVHRVVGDQIFQKG
jgi:hypothetical protein